MFDTVDVQIHDSVVDPTRPWGGLSGGSRELAEWPSDVLSDRLVELLELRERLDADIAKVTAAWQRKRGWEADGALSPVAWLTHRAPIAANDARHVVKVGKVVNDSPQLADALEHGDTTVAHVGALARVLSPRRQALLADHEDVLTEQAKRLSIKDFTLLARRWATLADDQLSTGEPDDEYRPRNELFAGVTMDGWIDGRFRLDPVTGTQLLGVLDHLAPPDPADAPDGVRSLSHRRGDALADLVGWFHEGATPGGNPPNIDVVIDVATLNGEPVDLARMRCDLDGVGPVTRATLDRIGCGATLRRVVMAGNSVVLDMGRKVRLATKAQQRAIRLRDGGCVFPSCDRPSRWCDIHHVDEFVKGGNTDAAKMVCLCRRHHTLIHNTKWTIVINPDGTFTIQHPTRAP